MNVPLVAAWVNNTEGATVELAFAAASGADAVVDSLFDCWVGVGSASAVVSPPHPARVVARTNAATSVPVIGT